MVARWALRLFGFSFRALCLSVAVLEIFGVKNSFELSSSSY